MLNDRVCGPKLNYVTFGLSLLRLYSAISMHARAGIQC